MIVASIVFFAILPGIIGTGDIAIVFANYPCVAAATPYSNLSFDSEFYCGYLCILGTVLFSEACKQKAVSSYSLIWNNACGGWVIIDKQSD